MIGMIPSGPIDASHVQLGMPMPYPPPPPPPSSKSSVVEILKLVIGVFIVLVLGAILIVLIVVPRTSSTVESNEKIGQLQRESNEEIARLQRQHEIALENDRQKNQNLSMEQQWKRQIEQIEQHDNLTERYRLEDRIVEEHHRQEDINRAMDQFRIQLEIEQRRFELLLEERRLAEQHRQEERSRDNTDLVYKFLDDYVYVSSVDKMKIENRIDSILRRIDPSHKSLLIDHFYRAGLLMGDDLTNPPLNLQGANLRELDLDGSATETGSVGRSKDYSRLALLSTNLINASFDELALDRAVFSQSDLTGASFVRARVYFGNFSHTILTLSDFQYADIGGSHFSSAKMDRVSFQNAKMVQAQMNNTNIAATDFQYVRAIASNFSQAEITNSSFQNADISLAQMDFTTILATNFYRVTARETNFARSYIPSCLFQWATLTEASFRNAVLPGSSFENANVQDADFTRAFLAGANITLGQLDTALSIANATLPDGRMAKNKNFVKNGHAQCSDANGTISAWNLIEDVIINGDQANNDCLFQATAINATLQQTIDINRYKRLIANGEGKVLVEMQVNPTNPTVYMILRFFDNGNAQIGAEASTMGILSSTALPKFTTRISCPVNTVKVQLNIVFTQVNATVDNIYLSIE